MLKAPENHYLTEKPEPANIEIAKFEVAYFSYLATMTGAAAIALLGLMYVGSSVPPHSVSLRVSVTAFVFAVSLLTTGYAVRNRWVMSRQPLPGWLVCLDFYLFGPATLISYLVGVVSLVVVVVTSRSELQ
jgi:hypothetical protein